MRYLVGNRTVDTDTLQVLVDDQEVPVEPQAFTVLCHLLEHRGRVVSKEELLDAVWQSRFVSESAVTTRIKQVRRVLGDNGRDQAMVRTAHGRGYQLVAPVEITEPGESATSTPAGTARSQQVRPPTRYADGTGASIAYQTFGEGPDAVLITGFATNVEAQWEHPAMADFLGRLGAVARVTVFDKRGVGLSDRLPHDTVPSLETRADDLNAVLDATGVERTAVIGSSEGGSLAAMYTAREPDRVERLVLHNTWVTGPDFARADSPTRDFVLRQWGTGSVYAQLSPGLDGAPDGRELLARYERQSATPRAAHHLLDLIGQVDVRGVLSAIAVPTLVLHRRGDPVVPSAHGEQLAAGIEGARLHLLTGVDHNLFSGDPTETIEQIGLFLADDTSVAAVPDRVLATVLFVEVSELSDSVDQPRNDVLGRFHELAHREVGSRRGRLVKSTADGIMASFDGPGRAVMAAEGLRSAVRELGLIVRAGLHTAEVQRQGDALVGVGVNIAKSVAQLAPAGEIWVSRTVTDLVAGTGLRFDSRGEHQLEGIEQSWQLFAAAA